ncbi:hypothetical protein INN71_03725 [Nocardioides sp. ChNu-153]|uniref:hypothetical protein n=1 Tax=Nocardioides sp. ChNu-153 TaxID=2779364 RepID=UPI00265566AF|nr:hypothetical protein [Nocardioides sp. ChNu-153]MDN7120497.1 hypothetical protein [Nocardioides sp. ChNu-153]
MLATLTAGLVSAPQVALAAPESVLRVVDVRLGGDGATTAVTTTTVRDADGDLSTDEETLDPADATLPVRVLTSWRSEDGAGTDLADLAGYDGRVTVDVTVQNTTVRPVPVRYDSGGEAFEEHALVGSPLTVVAGTELPGATRVVTSTLADDPAATNGVLGRTSDGTPVVQWAALLAPPRLASTATFRLVLDVDDFEPPVLDLSVQPGLVTDTSLDGLLRSAFADGPGSNRRVQDETIATIEAVNTVLRDAGASLDAIRANLQATSTGFGRQALTELGAGQEEVPARIAGVVADLEALSNSGGTGALDRTIDRAAEQGERGLVEALGSIRVLLGTAGATLPAPGPGAGTGCAVATRPPSGTDLLSLFRGVESQFEAFAGSTGACRAAIAASLERSVGTAAELEALATAPDATAACGTSRSLVCVLGIARGEVARGAGELVAAGAALAAEVNPAEETGRVVAGIAGLRTATARVGTALAALSTADAATTAAALEDVLAAARLLVDDLTALQVLLQSSGDLARGLDEVGTIATTQAALLDGGLVAALDELVRTACRAPEPDASPDLVAFLQDVLGALPACATTGAEPDVTAQLTGVAAAWDEVAALVGAGGTLPAALADLNTSVGGLLDTATDVVGALEQATALPGQLAALGDAICTTAARARELGEVPPTTQPCPAPEPGAPTAIDVLAAAWDGLAARNADLGDRVGAAFGAARTTYLDAARGDLGAGMAAAVGAQQSATDDLGTFLGGFEAELESAGDRAFAEGSDRVEGVDEAAAAALGSSRTTLTGDLARARGALADQIGVNQVALTGTSAALSERLRATVAALGSREGRGSGILGALASNARQADRENGNLVEAGGTTSAFAALRRLDLRDANRQRAQSELAARMQEELSRADADAGADADVLTVYALHLGGAG